MTVSILRYFGYGKETSFGTEATATQHVDVASTTLDVPSGAEIVIEGGMGRGALRKRPGFYSPSGSIEYTWDIRSIGWMLRYALGGYSFTTGEQGEKNIHEIWGTNYNELPSFTARCGKDLFEHVFLGSTINTLNINVTGDLATATMGILAQRDKRAALKDPADLLIPNEYPLAFYDFTAKIGSSDVSAYVRSFSLDINNNITANTGRTIGSRYPRKFRAGNRTCSLQVSLDFNDLTYLQSFWGGEDGPVNLGSSEIALEITGQAFATEGTITISLPRCVIMGIQTQPRGREVITQTLNLQALTDTDITLNDGTTKVSSDIYVKLLNDQTSMV